MELTSETVDGLKKKYQATPCHQCGEPITFKRGNGKRMEPYSLDGKPHWQTCPYSGLAQKRQAYGILRKTLVFLITKHGDKFEDIGLNPYESKVATAMLDREVKAQGGQHV